MTNEEYWREAILRASWNETNKPLSYVDFLHGFAQLQKQCPMPTEIDSAEADNLIRSIGCQPPEKEGK